LKIKNFGNLLVREDVMTSLDSLREAKAQKKATEIREANVGIRGTSQHLE
jgi:hypothetical protein